MSLLFGYASDLELVEEDVDMDGNRILDLLEPTEDSETITKGYSDKHYLGGGGTTGLQGPRGQKGDNGDAGSQGPQGQKGDKDDVGPRGATGPQGPSEPWGPQGNAGSSDP